MRLFLTLNVSKPIRALLLKRQMIVANRCVSYAPLYLHDRTISKCVCPMKPSWSFWRVCQSLALEVFRPWYDEKWALLKDLKDELKKKPKIKNLKKNKLFFTYLEHQMENGRVRVFQRMCPVSFWSFAPQNTTRRLCRRRICPNEIWRLSQWLRQWHCRRLFYIFFRILINLIFIKLYLYLYLHNWGSHKFFESHVYVFVSGTKLFSNIFTFSRHVANKVASHEKFSFKVSISPFSELIDLK